ncbi:MAG: retron-type reverse transcriptase [uncultured bacterium]|nr:MAG: retron-type reverse transcriptase [uncultured bacterium]KKP67667.1 MAG: Retron-type reverse transcriptase [Candidatus Moranbacteria bacterium GW2011_GWE1_35_17]KKP71526.1 MAG: Retron-type reverse transcriptase [Candidatus Moranbacteria bacterium GW2011_GWE2_35_164]KKP81021.1 MAG: Retron-type reverse transcriptase [Candidatus Moranbacteria bacterium GW2011_GWF1_35_5]KKP82724.1 MAG: Retron-type reverse transcriptase [Candidatus Moranbacteria bacterium GW2011_GWF2_35_54]HBR79519.1 reverse
MLKQKRHFSFQELLSAYYHCRNHKRNTINAAKFETNFEVKLLQLEKELCAHNYSPGRSVCFVVTEPKTREIFAADFGDRVIHHLLIERLEPIWEPKFIFHSYACRKDKGAIKAMLSLRKILKKTPSSHFLQIDIRSFFISLNKEILFKLIQAQVKNPEIIWLAKKIIFHDPTSNFSRKGQLKLFNLLPEGKSLFDIPNTRGLPIGNLTSQFFANVYLNELDQFVKHNLKAKYYLRYVDDMVILHSDPRQLQVWHDEIDNFLRQKLKLELHPEKTILKPGSQGINFVGYIVKPDYTIVRNRTIKKFKNKLWQFNQKILTKNPIQPIRLWTPELCEEFRQMLAIINSYYGVFKHADTYHLRQHLYEKHFNILKLYLTPANKNFDYFIWTEEK